MHPISRREYKVMLDHRHFLDRKDAAASFCRDLHSLTKRLRKVECDGEFDGTDKREIVFLDTIDETIHLNGFVFRQRTDVDGGHAMADVETFLESLTRSLDSTHKDPARMHRFAKRVLGDNHNEVEEAALMKRVVAYTAALAKMVERNASPVRYGYARLDAFGAILNEICATALEIPENRQPSDAPASYPFLWDTPQLDWVQWNGSANNPISRNVGEALGVFAHFTLTAESDAERFQSTVNVRNLFELEQQVNKLRAPAWPEGHLGPIDRVKSARGEKLFAQNCAKCHGVRGADGKFPLTEPNATGQDNPSRSHGKRRTTRRYSCRGQGLLQFADSRVGHPPRQMQRLQLLESSQLFQAGVGDRRSAKVQRLQLGQSSQLCQSCIRHGIAFKIQILQLFQRR
ncbi:MAG TPA: di-heme-cytochrome C peroxidase [Pirellulaceae bacterium]|nr:di-heme-cytochrome C peroxidase [Pirellulaceae bacterium]